MSVAQAQKLLVRKLDSIARLSEEEKKEVAALVGEVRHIAGRTEIVAHGTKPSHSLLLVDGLAYRYKDLPGGNRQVLCFQTGGDLVDLYSFVMRKMDHSIGAVTDCTLAVISHKALDQITERHPHLTKVLWRDTLIDGALFREWMVNIALRPAPQRLAHMICEVYLRMKAVGLASGNDFSFPVTQTDLAECFGLSVVHVNRTLKKLRADGLLELARGRVHVRNWEALAEFTEFEADYLHLDNMHSNVWAHTN